jgi:hypothetical protein
MRLRTRRKVLAELRSQYRGMLRLKCDTPETHRITDELRQQIREVELFW